MDSSGGRRNGPDSDGGHHPARHARAAYSSGLGTTVRENASAYGFSVAITGSFGVTSGVHGSAGVLEAVQFAHPAIASCVDIDPSQTEVTRHHLFASLVGTDTLVLETHFAPPTAGTVVAHGNGYRMIPVGKPD